MKTAETTAATAAGAAILAAFAHVQQRVSA
jgi:hypothetical protein